MDYSITDNGKTTDNSNSEKTETPKFECSTPKQTPQREMSTFECNGTTFVVDKKYKFIREIGYGAYGVVCSALDIDEDVKVAIKKIGNVFDDWRDAKRIVREIKLLRFFQHENIIQLRDIIKPPLKTGYKDIYIVMELMDTDLHKVIKSKQVLSDDHIKYFVFQILLGLKYMHSANVIHRDLKPNNLLVNKECKVKICDLGLARGFELENELKTEYVTTRFYRAPEVLLSVSEYSKAIDVWSVGCIFGELLTRTIIFPGKDPLDQLHHILAILGTPSNEEMKFIKSEMALRYIKTLPKRDKQDWKNIIPKTNPLACDLLEKMLTFNPETRYCVDDCLNHPYLKDLTDKFEVRSCESTFDWSFDNQDNSIEALQTIIYNESLAFHPENQMTNDGC